jgi:hypothetical protein
MRRILLGLAASLVCCLPVLSFQQVNQGTYRVDLERPDDLLFVADIPDVHVLVISDGKTASISDVHLASLRDWVARGGAVWVEGEGLESGLVGSLVSVSRDRFDFYKTTGDRNDGELVVRDALPQHVIHDHPLTQGVERLYLYPRWDFTGTPKLEPLVEMTNPEGDRAVVLGAVPYGKGWIVLDGTARAQRRAWWPFGRARGFDEDHPNAIRLGERWNSYDWDRLLRATAQEAEETLAANVNAGADSRRD